MTQRYVVCEGYHDRAFLQGLFADRLALTEARRDDDGKAIRDGQYGYRSRSGHLIRVVPFHRDRGERREGRAAVFREVANLIMRYPTNPSEVVTCTDEDEASSAADAEDRAARGLATAAQVRNPAPRMQHDIGMSLFAVAWACDDQDSEELPRTQCLERLVVAALRAASPDRAAHVSRFLRARVDARADASYSSKAYMWAHMAGWYAGLGCDAFLRQVWRDTKVASEIEARLRQTSAWEILEGVAR